MFKLNRLLCICSISCVLALFSCTACLAQEAQDQDDLEISNYVLSQQGLAKFTQATDSLAALAAEHPGDCNSMGDAQSLDDMVAGMEASPGVKAAIGSAGMSTREYLLFTLAGAQAGMAAWVMTETKGELPPGMSQANVDFYRAHEAEFQAISQPKSSGNCEDDDEQ